MPLDVCSVNLGRRLAILTNGELLSIATLLDHDGDETDDPAQAAAFVTAPDTTGKEWRDKMDDYPPITRPVTKH